MVEIFANSGDPDQMPHSAASDLGLHSLSVTHLGVSSVQWVKLLFAVVIGRIISLIGSVGRTPDLQVGVRGFESCTSHTFSP